MKINEDCIRNILLYLSVNLTLDLKDNKNNYNKISVLELMNDLSDEYEKEDIVYSVNILYQAGYINGINLDQKNISLSRLKINDITNRGHIFCQNVGNPTVWDKTKKIISQVGNHTLSFIEGVAHDIAVETSKEMVKSMMSSK